MPATIIAAPPAPQTTGVASLRREFPGARGYLAACTAGLPPLATRAAVRADLDARPDPARYSLAVESSRASAARLLGTEPGRVAIASQTSVTVGMIAASLPIGAEVLCAEGDFSSLVLPFVHSGRDLRVRFAPLAELADAVRPTTALVAFSLVQSACGEVADPVAIAAAARAVGARTLCDATQAAGWMPVDASLFDAVVCHAYKWLCAPRGVAFLAVSAEFGEALRPIHAGWYAGDDPWASCYGGDAVLASDARRFDVSPAWQAFVGADPALRLFADADMPAVERETTRLADRFRAERGLRGTGAIVSWPDPDGDDLTRLSRAGIAASGRRGRTRVAFHVFNDDDDVDDAVRALTA